MTETEARVYFAIKTGDESIEESIINNSIGLRPTKFVKKHANGDTPKCTIWELSTERVKNPYVSDLVDEILCIIELARVELKEFKQKYTETDYILQIVIYHGDNAEGFWLSNKHLLLLGDNGASVDVDQYNYKE